ncbi:cytochrome P450 [Galbibacter mesophilus]|uniref:cytochrome P450 n=1 Tax=Galbibacter mesophilus TaxID=379069 RepID=UPI00191E5195|nr:cytochrome P450 [Galbibacter mesophilus]MCM5661881.1 cytochrome P450 [Galbibacter mesophilus]
MKNLPKVPQWRVILNAQRILKNPISFHQEIFEELGDNFMVKTPAGKPVVFTRTPQIIRHVLQKNHANYKKSTLQTEDLANYIGNGLLTAEGEHWLVHRRMIQPGFHKKKLVGLLGIMHEAIQNELRQITPESNFDVYSLMGDLAFQVVAKSLFSRSDIRESMAKLQKITEDNQQMVIKEMRQPYLQWWFALSGMKNRHLKFAADGRQILNTIIEERITSAHKKNDLLDMLLEATYEDGSHMSRQQLIDEVLILFTAGHETTANTLSFTLYLLAKNPGAQEKIYQEIKELDFHQENLYEIIGKLPFTKACLEESMRLFPPVYIIDRVAKDDDEVANQEIKKDTLMLLSIFELHRNKDFWEQPDDFHPERFLKMDKKEYSEYYYPFGAGPRMCVGNNFAMFEMLLVLAEIFKKYTVSTEMDNMELNPLISLKPKKVAINFKERRR